jgi:hypothetical protein
MKVYKIGSAPSNAIYIGRGSNWGNPFVIGKDGNRNEVIAKFRAYAEKMLKENPEWLVPLEGKDVYCFCAPLACHGDVLASLVRKGE